MLPPSRIFLNFNYSIYILHTKNQPQQAKSCCGFPNISYNSVISRLPIFPSFTSALP